MNQVVTTLLAMRGLFTDPAKFTRNTFARRADGAPVDATDPQACSFCTYGAAQHIEGVDSSYGNVSVSAALTRAAKQMLGTRGAGVSNNHPVVFVNDYIGREAVLEMIDIALAAERGDVCAPEAR